MLKYAGYGPASCSANPSYLQHNAPVNDTYASTYRGYISILHFLVLF